MATYFPNQQFDTSQFNFGLTPNNLGALPNGTPTFLSANIGAQDGGPTIQNASQGDLWSSIFNQNSAFGGRDSKTGMVTGGWVSPLASIGAALFQGIQGNKQLGLAQDQFKENKRQFDANFAAQRQTTNTQLEDRQRARVASNPGAYESVDSYLKRNSV